MRSRGHVVQQKTNQPVQFEITEQTRASIQRWLTEAKLAQIDHLFPSRVASSPHLSTRQYARAVQGWVTLIGLGPTLYGTHSLRRTKATLIYRRIRNLRAVQLLLGHTTLECTITHHPPTTGFHAINAARPTTPMA